MPIAKREVKFLLIFVILASWIFSGWPRIFNFPNAIPVAQVTVTFVNAGTAATANSGDVLPGIPSGIANNDILILVVHSRDNVDSSVSGWTEKLAGNDGTTNRLEIFWKRTTGSESAPTVSHSAGSAIIGRIYAFRGVTDSGDPFNVAGSVQSNSGSPISTAAVVTTENNAMVLHVFGSQDDNTWGSFTGTPTNDGGQTAFNGPGSNDSSMGLTYGALVIAGSTGIAGASQTVNEPDAGASVQMALRPADNTAPAAVTNLAVGSPGQNSMPLTWTAPGDDGSTRTATTYDIRHSTSIITSGNFSSATQVSGEPTPSVAGSGESMTVTGLSASAT